MYKSLHLHSRYQIWSQTREADKLNRNEQWNISLIPSFLPQKIEKETNKVIKIRNFIWKRSIVKCSTTNRPLCYQPYSSIHPNPKIAFVLFEAQNIRLCYAVWTRGRTLITFRFYGIAVPLVFLSRHIAHNTHAMRMPISLLHKRCLYQCYLKCEYQRWQGTAGQQIVTPSVRVPGPGCHICCTW